MNKNIDLTKILEGCPSGTMFYSSDFEEVVFVELSIDNEYEYYPEYYPIKLRYHLKDNPDLTVPVWVTKSGKTWPRRDGDGECTLFPSRDQRDWSKFVRFWDK